MQSHKGKNIGGVVWKSKQKELDIDDYLKLIELPIDQPHPSDSPEEVAHSESGEEI